MCILEMRHEIDNYYFHQQNSDKRIKANQGQDFYFRGGSERSYLEWLHKELF